MEHSTRRGHASTREKLNPCQPQPRKIGQISPKTKTAQHDLYEERFQFRRCLVRIASTASLLGIGVFKEVDRIGIHSIALPVSLSIHPSIYLCLSIYLHVHPFTYLSVSLSISLSVCLSICLSIHPSPPPSIHLSFCLSDCLSVYLSTYLPVCLHVCL